MFNTNKKIIFVLAFVFVLNAIFFSANVFAQRKRIKYDIIDQRGGKRAKQPKWMFKGTTALEKDYPNKMAFIISGRGKSLNFLGKKSKFFERGCKIFVAIYCRYDGGFRIRRRRKFSANYGNSHYFRSESKNSRT